ncbi:MAG: ABC transporter ATP-binding protein [Bacteroidales bacterium]|jgi:ATP-binding cassette, subfamily B, bacterial MsbA|nr:ABC transporter ATP-binding protein/permease [Bacteroidales bacterium]MDD4394268.1 ABC transporter ATP-binding protein [Bacteroidales bacterium]
MKIFLRLIRYVFPYKKNIVFIFLANLLYAVFSVFSLSMIAPFLSVLFGQAAGVTTQPVFDGSVQSILDTFYYYMGQIITSYGIFYALLFIAVSMILLSLLSNFFRYMGLYAIAPIRAGLVKSLRKDIYHRLLILPLSFYNKQKKGDILNRMGSDVQEVEWSIVCSLQMVFRDPLLLIVFLITLFSLNYKLTLIALVILPFAGVLIAKIGKSIKKNSVEAQQILGKMSSAFDEAISGLRIIKGYNAIDHTHERFKTMNHRFYILNKRIFRKAELGSPLVELLCIIALVLVLLFGATFILNNNELNPSLFIMFIVIFARIIPPAQSLVSSFYTIQKGMASAERIYKIIDAEEIIEEATDPISFHTFSESIDYKNVSFSYQQSDAFETNTEVVSNISFTLRKGENIALVGASGSGKSTLVDLLPRFYDIQKGEILIDGINSKLLKISDLRKIFGIVNQDVILFNDTVYNNIAFGKSDVTKEMVVAAAQTALAHEFIMEMENGYDTVIGDRGMKLSGGQRQRLSIARAVLQNPQVLILDEATSALDTESEFLVQQSLQKLMENRTTIVIAHRLSTIRNADMILFVQNGQIVERGNHEQLMAQNGGYCKFCTLQDLK